MTENRITGDMKTSFDTTYPTITWWVKSWGRIALGRDEYSRSMVRAMDEGGMVWEGNSRYATLDALFQDLESGLADWLEENE